MWKANICDIKLATSGAGGTTTKATAEPTATRTKVTARRAADEARLGLTVLQVVSAIPSSGTVSAYLAHIDETAHEILVAQRVDSILCLLPRCVFNNPVAH